MPMGAFRVMPGEYAAVRGWVDLQPVTAQASNITTAPTFANLCKRTFEPSRC